MDYPHLLQMGHLFQEIVKAGQDHDREPRHGLSALEIYNEDLQRLSPGNIAEIPEGSVAFINCIGPMMKYWSWWFVGADEIVHQLDFVNNLQNIKAIVIYIDGPGGAVSAINPFIEFAKRKKKPIVALCDNSLSLHRWIPDAIADYQIADNPISSRFGSIGVVSSWYDLTKYYEDLGVILEEVYPEESKHKNEIWRMYKDDPEKAREMLRKKHLSPMAQKFQEAVKAAHPNLIQEEGVLSGRTFSAEDAVRLNMINKIGTKEEAMTIALSLAEMINI